jgi:hypothetical protein
VRARPRLTERGALTRAFAANLYANLYANL